MNTVFKYFVLMLSLSTSLHAERTIAITIDDLPFVGGGSGERGFERTAKRFNQILDALVEKHVPATGFIIGSAVTPGQMKWLENFKQQGFSLGNHTHTHISLSRVGAEKYIHDMDKADQKLADIMTSPKYFRYPYLDEGKGNDKAQVYDYLVTHQYTIAPVTIDSKDYAFNERLLRINWRNRPERLPAIKKEYLNYIDRQISKAEKMHKEDRPEILLIHAYLINSHAMGDVIDLFKERGYRFITLDEAIQKSGHHQEPSELPKPTLHTKVPASNEEVSLLEMEQDFTVLPLPTFH